MQTIYKFKQNNEMFYKTIVLINISFFALNQIQSMNTFKLKSQNIWLNFIFIATDCLFVSVGDYRGYEGVNGMDCGLRYKTEIHNISRSNKCFKKATEDEELIVFPNHQTQFITKLDQISSRIYNGRDERKGESPWTVRLFFEFRRDAFGRVEEYTDVCSGSLITYQWILTAAHCIDRSVQYLISPFNNNHCIWSRYKSEVLSIDVFAGSRYERNVVNLKKLFYHPGWVKPTGPQAKKEHDIALLKLEKKYEQEYKRFNYYGLNTICLPNKSKLNDNKENATFAGWGAINEQGTLPKKLQIAEAILKPHRLCSTANLCADFVGKQPRTCKVSFIL